MTRCKNALIGRIVTLKTMKKNGGCARACYSGVTSREAGRKKNDASLCSCDKENVASVVTRIYRLERIQNTKKSFKGQINMYRNLRGKRPPSAKCPLPLSCTRQLNAPGALAREITVCAGAWCFYIKTRCTSQKHRILNLVQFVSI